MASLGDEQTIMFDEKVIKEAIEDLDHKKQNQKASVIKRTRLRFEDNSLSIISEKSLDQTIILNRQGSESSNFGLFSRQASEASNISKIQKKK